MFHLALGPFGWGVMVGAGGLWLWKRSGKQVAEVAGTVAGVATAVASEGTKLVKKTLKTSPSKES